MSDNYVIFNRQIMSETILRSIFFSPRKFKYRILTSGLCMNFSAFIIRKFEESWISFTQRWFLPVFVRIGQHEFDNNMQLTKATATTSLKLVSIRNYM